MSYPPEAECLMATEEQAHRAREQYGDKLRDLGAHAIAVDEVQWRGVSTFAVIAMFEHKPTSSPKSLPIKTGRKTVDVPLVVRRSPKFRLE